MSNKELADAFAVIKEAGFICYGCKNDKPSYIREHPEAKEACNNCIRQVVYTPRHHTTDLFEEN